MVSATLNLVDHLLARVRLLQQLGRNQDAFRLLSRLASFRDLPGHAVEEVQLLLGELALRRRKYGRARRHLTLALRQAPENARAHYFLALAWDRDRDGDPARAAEHFRSSLAQDATQVDCLCAFAALAQRMGQTDEAVECWHAAASLAPDDDKVLRRVVAGLRMASRTEEARGLLLAARFRHPRDARYQALWNDFQFQQARRLQETARRTRSAQQKQRREPVLLPFVPQQRPAEKTVMAGRILRHDGPSSTTPHQPRTVKQV